MQSQSNLFKMFRMVALSTRRLRIFDFWGVAIHALTMQNGYPPQQRYQLPASGAETAAQLIDSLRLEWTGDRRFHVSSSTRVFEKPQEALTVDLNTPYAALQRQSQQHASKRAAVDADSSGFSVGSRPSALAHFNVPTGGGRTKPNSAFGSSAVTGAPPLTPVFRLEEDFAAQGHYFQPSYARVAKAAETSFVPTFVSPPTHRVFADAVATPPPSTPVGAAGVVREDAAAAARVLKEPEWAAALPSQPTFDPRGRQSVDGGSSMRPPQANPIDRFLEARHYTAWRD